MSVDAISTAPIVAVLAGPPDLVHPTPAHFTPAGDPFGPAVVVGPSVGAPLFIVYDSHGYLSAPIPPHVASPDAVMRDSDVVVVVGAGLVSPWLP